MYQAGSLAKLLLLALAGPTHCCAAALIRLAVYLDAGLESHASRNLGLPLDQLAEVYVGQVEANLQSLAAKAQLKLQLQLVQVSLIDKLNTTNIDLLLGQFCLLQANQRAARWDLALLLTPQDLYSGEEAAASSLAASSTTLGISPLGGIHEPELSCAVVEFGLGYADERLLDSAQRRVYPTRGFGSAWTAAHEIAHNLAVYHDGPPFSGACDADRFIMSPRSRLPSVPTQWSECSAADLRRQDLAAFERHGRAAARPLPGRVLDADAQCRAFSARLSSPGRAAICCASLECLASDGSPVAVGPALDGTECAADGTCIQGVCTWRASGRGQVEEGP